MPDYVHGYSGREAERLSDQAQTLSELIHHDTIFPDHSLVLEAGCGTGAQTVIVAPKNPRARFISIDISETSLAQAKENASAAGINHVEFRVADILHLDFPDAIFDHIMVCFVLEHLPGPDAALHSLKRVLKPGGSITLIEGDHGSAYFFPRSDAADAAIDAQVVLQAASGGNALIGRELYPLLTRAGFHDCGVSPRMVYADASRPEMVEGFTKNTFTAMIEGVRENALHAGLIDPAVFDKGISDLYRSAEPDGVFCYTFFKGSGIK
ncbi:MAG: methyltransferase type 11 [Spirochaetes bacterium GWF1_49_6]|nr:MAG: methyltransferase type 11 [Spirochaetes bacterium GWF1_49_6]